MTFTGSGESSRPHIFDIANAIVSSEELKTRPSRSHLYRWRQIIQENLLTGRFVRLTSGALELWVFMGVEEDHVLVTARRRPAPPRGEGARLPVYCSCKGFQLRLVQEDEPPACTHVYALLALLRGTGRARPLDLGEVDVGTLTKVVKEVLTNGRSETLRELLRPKSAAPSSGPGPSV